METHEMRASKFLNRRFCNLLFALVVILVGLPLVAQKAKAVPFKKETITNSLGMTFVKIPAGSFVMGASSGTKFGECPDCNGSGKKEVARTRTETSESSCRTCAGSGREPCNMARTHAKGEYCSVCNNTGMMRCYTCNGSGRGTSSSRTVTDGYDIRLCTACKGKGKRNIDTGGGEDNEKPAHKVTLTKAFFLQTTVVTQGQWKAVMDTTPWSGKEYVKEGDDYPAVYVSWDNAQAFIQKLNAKGNGTYRLPTEAEWEYACRAGTTTKFSFGDDEAKLGDYAWFTTNADDAGEKYAHRVRTKLPNPWGLYDMHGNVWQWCQDWYGNAYPSGGTTNPTGPSSGSSRVLRGGSWGNGAGRCSASYRLNVDPDSRNYYSGFRVVYSGARKK